MAAQRAIRIVVAILASVLSMALSWPYWRDFEYWPESRGMWALYFAVGFVLAVYVFYVFFDCVATLFVHDAAERRQRQQQDSNAGAPAPDAR